MASKISRRDARHAGITAAIAPAASDSSARSAIRPTGTLRQEEPLGLERRGERPRPHQPEGEADGATDGSDDHRLPAHRPAQLAPGHPHRAEHADLVGALVHRERQRVHDPEHRDRLGEEEQGDEHAEELVDQFGLRVAHLVLGQHLEVGEVAPDLPFDRRLRRAHRHARQRPTRRRGSRDRLPAPRCGTARGTRRSANRTRCPRRRTPRRRAPRGRRVGTTARPSSPTAQPNSDASSRATRIPSIPRSAVEPGSSASVERVGEPAAVHADDPFALPLDRDPPEVEADRTLHLGQRLHPVDHLGRESGELRGVEHELGPEVRRRTRRSAPWPTRRAPPPSPPARDRSPARWPWPRCGAGCASRSPRAIAPGTPAAALAPGRRTSVRAAARTPPGAPRCRRRAGAHPARPTAARPTRRRRCCARVMPTSSTGMPTPRSRSPTTVRRRNVSTRGFGEIPDRRHRRDARRPDRGPERGADRHHEPHRDREHDGPRHDHHLPARDAEAEGVDQRHEQPCDDHAEQHARRPTPARRRTPASTTTDVMTCRRDAPRARNNPSSWVRWVTRIVNVLKMMNAPTTTPRAAKPSRSPVRRSTNSPTSWFRPAHDLIGIHHVVCRARGRRAASAAARRPRRRARCARTPRRVGRRPR